MTDPHQRALLPLAAVALLVPTAALAQETGTITGTFDRPALVRAVQAVERASGKKYAGKLDGNRFTIAGLPLGKPYDCLIDFGDARLEGVSLKVPRSDFEEEQPLTREDRDHLARLARTLNQFEDTVEVLTVHGNAQHAAVLMSKLRTTPFVGSKPGEMVWRLELWKFDRPDDTWLKSRDELWVLYYRERLPKSAYDQKSLTLDPVLGGIEPTAQTPAVDVGQVALPPATPGIRLRAGQGA